MPPLGTSSGRREARVAKLGGLATRGSITSGLAAVGLRPTGQTQSIAGLIAFRGMRTEDVNIQESSGRTAATDRPKEMGNEEQPLKALPVDPKWPA